MFRSINRCAVETRRIDLSVNLPPPVLTAPMLKATDRLGGGGAGGLACRCGALHLLMRLPPALPAHRTLLARKLADEARAGIRSRSPADDIGGPARDLHCSRAARRGPSPSERGHLSGRAACPHACWTGGSSPSRWIEQGIIPDALNRAAPGRARSGSCALCDAIHAGIPPAPSWRKRVVGES